MFSVILYIQFFSLQSKHVSLQVLISLNECDEEIAHYARTKKAFAILGQDTDFVILDKGEAWYLSMEKLRLDDMTTLLYDHKALAHYLKIHVTQLPVLATLMGNDIIDHKDIKVRIKYIGQILDEM